MQYDFLNVFLNQRDFLTSSDSGINPFLLENNKSQLEKIYEFYKGNLNLLYINGYLGSGKVSLVKHSLTFLSKETIILKYNCFNSTVLDDILLSFFNEFKNLASQNVISELKVKTENFTQKVNAYFSHIERPFLIILDSFEAILDENKKEILDFIFHLKTISKVKIIIIGRTFDLELFKDMEIARVITHGFDRQLFDKYLKSQKINAFPELYEEFYKQSHGYYFFTAFSVKIMNAQKLSLFDFLTEFKDSYAPFHKFLTNQALKMVAPAERRLYMFLSIIRHPVSVSLLKKLDLYNEIKIKELTDNLILAKDGDNIYINDYLKDELDQNVFGHVLTKTRRSIIELYTNQLPLKPLERDICISRQTMRKEIEFHSLFLPKAPKFIEMANLGVNFVAHKKQFGNQALSQNENENEIEAEENLETEIQELIEAAQSGQKTLKENSPKEHSFRELLELIEKSEISYDYSNMVKYANEILLREADEDYQKELIKIYLKLAFAYHELAQYENSLKYYELVLDLYNKNNDLKQANYIKFNIAKIYYNTYKVEKAKALLNEISQAEVASDYLLVKTYLQLANIEDDSSAHEKAFTYYSKAVEKSNDMMNVKLLSELYFKYALALDDRNEGRKAREYYQKCIDLNGDLKINPFISSAYSNIATLYYENNDTENAVYNYTKAFEIDKENENYEGAYYSSSKLASLLQRKSPEEAIPYFNAALQNARKTRDVFYIISATLALGDFHYDRRKDEVALKYFLKALDLAQDNLSKDNVSKIEVRLNDLKFRLGKDRFDSIVEIVQSQGEHEQN